MIDYVMKTRQTPEHDNDTIVLSFEPGVEKVGLAVAKGGSNTEASGTTLTLEQTRQLITNLYTIVQVLEDEVCTPSS